jgi:hypothetical protein
LKTVKVTGIDGQAGGCSFNNLNTCAHVNEVSGFTVHPNQAPGIGIITMLEDVLNQHLNGGNDADRRRKASKMTMSNLDLGLESAVYFDCGGGSLNS